MFAVYVEASVEIYCFIPARHRVRYSFRFFVLSVERPLHFNKCLMLNYWYMSAKSLYTCSLDGIRIHVSLCPYKLQFVLYFWCRTKGEVSLYLQGQLVWVPLSSDRWPPLLPVWVWRSKKMAGQQMWLSPEIPLPETWRKTRQTFSWSFKIIHLTQWFSTFFSTGPHYGPSASLTGRTHLIYILRHQFKPTRFIILFIA